MSEHLCVYCLIPVCNVRPVPEVESFVSLHYTIQPENPAAHLFRISLTLDVNQLQSAVAATDWPLTLRLPDWIPGSYMIRDFARNIVEIDATLGARPASVSKLDKSAWQVEPGPTPENPAADTGSLVVTYLVYAWELSVRACHLDEQHGFFNGTSVFLSVAGCEQQNCTVDILRPQGSAFDEWRLATAMQSRNTDKDGFGTYEVADYDELIDHPVEMGTFERLEFSACGVPHEVILTGSYRTDNEAIKSDLRRICEAQIKFFGEPAPMSRFLFFVMVVGNGYGGLEHRASTSLLVSRDDLPAPTTAAKNLPRDDKRYIDFLGLCSHEYFHCWNVKRIKPAVFVPYQLDRETYTELLWAFEGITSYYDDLFLVRTGLISQSKYLQKLGETVTRVYRGSGRLRQSVAESSFDAWTRFYKQDENAPNAIVSYYAKGSLVAFCLDMLIRQRSDDRFSLNDLMLRLWADWQADPCGVTEADFESVTEELCGGSCADFFASAVFGREDLDLQSACDVAGLSLHWRALESAKDKGGKAGAKGVAATELPEKEPLDAGMTVIPEPQGLQVKVVFDDGAAQRSGLAAGDIIVAIDKLSVMGKTMDDALSRFEAGEEIPVHAFRHGELIEFKFVCQSGAQTACWFESKESGVITGWLDESAA